MKAIGKIEHKRQKNNEEDKYHASIHTLMVYPLLTLPRNH